MRKLLEELMLELLKTYSPTGYEEKAVRRYVEIVSSIGIGNVYVDYAGNALLDYGEGNGKWVLLAGHIDTVSGELPVTYDGNVFKGRGAVDAKGPLVAMTVGALEAFKHIGTKCRVTVAALVGEEGKSPGARALIKSLISKGIRPNAIIVGEPSGCDGVVVGYRGSIKLKLKCIGSGGHSSDPNKGVSAIEELINLWLNVRSLSTSLQVSMGMNYIRGGEAFSVIPKECEALVDIRIPVDLELPVIKSKIIEYISSSSTKCVPEVIEETPPVRVSINMPIVRALIRSIIRNGLKPIPSIKLGTSDMNLLVSLTNNIVSYGPGRPELSHTDYEEISINELELSAKVYRDVIIDYCNHIT